MWESQIQLVHLVGSLRLSLRLTALHSGFSFTSLRVSNSHVPAVHCYQSIYKYYFIIKFRPPHPRTNFKIKFANKHSSNNAVLVQSLHCIGGKTEAVWLVPYFMTSPCRSQGKILDVIKPVCLLTLESSIGGTSISSLEKMFLYVICLGIRTDYHREDIH